jgi:hypothetical protein
MPVAPSNVKVAVLLCRDRMILPALSPFSTAYLARRQAQTRATSLPPSPDFYFKRGSSGEAAWLAAQTPALGGIVRLPVLQESELAAVEIPEVVSEGPIDSLNRWPDRVLYLMKKEKDGWRLPSVELKSDELLHEVFLYF